MLLVTVYYWHWHKIKSHQFGNPFVGTLVRPFRFCQWLHVCAVKCWVTHTTYGSRCGWSHWLITIQYVQAQRGSIVSWQACSRGSEKAVRVSRSVGNFLNGFKKVFANYDYWLKRMTCWYVISLKCYRKMAVHKCYAFCLKSKIPLSPTLDACCPLLAPPNEENLFSLDMIAGIQPPGDYFPETRVLNPGPAKVTQLVSRRYDSGYSAGWNLDSWDARIWAPAQQVRQLISLRFDSGHSVSRRLGSWDGGICIPSTPEKDNLYTKSIGMLNWIWIYHIRQH